MRSADQLASFLLLVAAALYAGCAGQRPLVDEQQASVIDSLHLAIFSLQDSLRFFQDIDSGQYDRDLRVLQDRINRLEYDAAVCRDGGRVVTTFLVDDLFEPGGTTTLSAGGQERLGTLAALLKERYPDRTFRVEGHSDDVPLGPGLRDRYASNWEFSAARAAAVVRYLTEAQEIPAGRLEVVAFGNTRPVSTNKTAEGRRLNRRVRVTVMPEPSSL